MITFYFLLTFTFFLYSYQKTTNILKTFSLHTWFFVFFLLMHVFSLLYIKYINISILERFPGLNIESLDKTFIAMSIFMISFSLGLFFINYILFKSRNLNLNISKKKIYLDTLKKEKYLIIFFSLLFIISILFYLITVKDIPFFIMFDNIGDKTTIYNARRSVKFDLTGYKYVMLIIRTFGVLIVTYLFIKYLYTKKGIFLFLLFLILLIFANLLSFHRSPALWILIYIFTVWYAVKNNFKLVIKKEVFLVIICIFLMFFAIQWLITQSNIEDVLEQFIVRAFLGQNLTLITYFTVYPDINDYIGFGFSSPLSILTSTPLHIPAEEIYGFVAEKEFTRPIVYNTIGIGDFYAGFGYFGVFVYGFITACILQFFNIYLINTKLTIMSLSIMFTLMYMFMQLNSVNILVVLSSWGIGYLTLILFIIRRKNESDK